MCRLDHLNYAAWLTIAVLSKELRKTHFRVGPHRRMNEKLNP
jgi:hypothetical protein